MLVMYQIARSPPTESLKLSHVTYLHNGVGPSDVCLLIPFSGKMLDGVHLGVGPNVWLKALYLKRSGSAQCLDERLP